MLSLRVRLHRGRASSLRTLGGRRAAGCRIERNSLRLIRLRPGQSADQGQARHCVAATNRTGVFRLVVNAGSKRKRVFSSMLPLRPERRFSHPVLNGALAARFIILSRNRQTAYRALPS